MRVENGPDALPNRSGVGTIDWDSVYRLCAPALRRFIRTKVPEALVEDTLQDTFLRAYRSRARFDPARPPLPWLLTIARRACWETLRVLPPDVPLAAADPGPPSLRDDPHQHFEWTLRIEAMSGALGGLSPRHRRLLRAWDFGDHSAYQVLAVQEGISPKALKSALCRARSAFRSRYSALAERSGVAALVTWRPGRRLRRSFNRYCNDLTQVTGAVEAAAGVVAAFVVTVAVVLVPTYVASGANPLSGVGARGAQSVDGYGISESVVQDPVAPRDTTPSAIGLRIPQPAKPLPGGTGTRGGLDVGVGEGASDATVTLGVDDPTGSLNVVERVELRCNGEVRQHLCGAARQTPLAR